MASPQPDNLLLDQKPSAPSMSSPGDEKAPISNGINGHVSPEAPQAESNAESIDKPAAPANDASTTPEKIVQNDVVSSSNLAEDMEKSLEFTKPSEEGPALGPAEDKEKEPEIERDVEMTEPGNAVSPGESKDVGDKTTSSTEESAYAPSEEAPQASSPIAPAAEAETSPASRPKSPESAQPEPDDNSKPASSAAEDPKPASEVSQPEVDADVSMKEADGVQPEAGPEPAEETQQTTSTETQPQPNTSQDNPEGHITADTSMSDAPAPLPKVPRGREEDDVEEPSAKRTKTEDGSVDPAPETSSASAPVETQASSEAPAEAPAAQSESMVVDTAPKAAPVPTRAEGPAGTLGDKAQDHKPISAHANRETRKVLGGIKKTKAGSLFKDSVNKLWPLLWESYSAKVTQPVDISLIERKLRTEEYGNLGELVSDVHLIYENSLLFNGAFHDVTHSASTVVSLTFDRLAAVSAEEPARPEKKETKLPSTRHAEPRAATQRRASRGAATAPVQDVVEAKGPVAFPAGGTPIIRRDSTKHDGDRPKRPVQPPKNRDLPYESKNLKKKKMTPDFKFCDEVLRELTKPRNWNMNQWFLKPVDPVNDGVPDYHSKIKKPMDLGTMTDKLNAGLYNSAKEFEADFKLIIKNCFKFNTPPETHLISVAAKDLQSLFDAKWKDKDAWIAAHAPAKAASVSSGGDAGRDDSDEDEDVSEQEDAEEDAGPVSSATLDALNGRLAEENQRLVTLLSAKVPDATMVATQQTMINMLMTQLIDEKKKIAEQEKTKKKPSKPKAKAKKAAGGAAPSKKAAAAAGTSKKAGGGAKKAQKARFMGQLEKDLVSENINELDGTALERAIDIIKKDTHQEEGDEGELELDIDQLSQDALGKIYDLIVKHVPKVKARFEKLRGPPPPEIPAQHLAKAHKPKKHKPMGKAEQERNIEKLREIKAQFQRPGSGSQEPLPSVEAPQQSKAQEESEQESEADSEEE